MTEWNSILPSDLLEIAYEAENGELAWPRQTAIHVANLLRKSGYVIIGVDIWLPTRPGPTIPTPFVYDWSLSMETPSADYPLAAIEFIRSFRWDIADKSRGNMEPYFNIVARRSDS